MNISIVGDTGKRRKGEKGNRFEKSNNQLYSIFLNFFIF